MVLEAASEPESLAQGHARQSIISESVCLLLTELRPQVSPGPLCCVLPSESQVPAHSGGEVTTTQGNIWSEPPKQLWVGIIVQREPGLIVPGDLTGQRRWQKFPWL